MTKQEIKELREKLGLSRAEGLQSDGTACVRKASHGSRKDCEAAEGFAARKAYARRIAPRAITPRSPRSTAGTA